MKLPSTRLTIAASTTALALLLGGAAAATSSSDASTAGAVRLAAAQDAADEPNADDELDNLEEFLDDDALEDGAFEDGAFDECVEMLEPTEEELAAWEAEEQAFLDALPQELIDELTAEADALRAFLDDAGIAYEDVTDGPLTYPEWDGEDDAANDAVEQFFVDRHGVGPDEFVDELLETHLGDLGEFDDEFEDAWDESWEECDDWEPSEEEIAEINAEMDGLAAAFDEAGIAYTRETDPFGIAFVEWDHEDDEANAVADAFFEELYGDCEDGHDDDDDREDDEDESDEDESDEDDDVTESTQA